MSEPRLRLSAVVQALRAARLLEEVRGDVHAIIAGVSQDSRTVGVGDLFLAWKGEEHDAHGFLEAAVRAGAVAAVVERFVPDVEVPQLKVSDGRRAAAVAADRVLSSPWKELFLAGITGTNGKTTTTVLGRHLLSGLGPAAAMGTLGLMGADGSVWPGSEGLTTPGPVRTSTWLRALVSKGVRYVAMEASSHALAQHRLDGVRFDVAVFTNLSRDHLDYHGGPPAYFRAKARLLELLKPNGTVVVNRDDPSWDDLPAPPGALLTFGTGDGADLRARDIRVHPGGARFVLEHGGESASVELPLTGAFNVENALAAAGVARAAGLGLEETCRALEGAPQVPGRLEKVTDDPFTVLIDFAHTPDALARVLDALKPLVSGKLIVVFGAGGDRDREKRPLMAEAATSRADLALLTSDNPRTENPDAIIDDLVKGARGGRWERITDRRRAIARALELAREEDVVLLAGKGHERYQIVGREKRPFDEREIVRELLSGGRAA